MKNTIFSGILIIAILTISISLFSEQIMAQTMMSPRQQMMMGTTDDDGNKSQSNHMC
jgi:hypothetical protein